MSTNKFLLLFLVVFTASCSSSIKYTKSGYVKPMSARKIVKKHINANNKKQTINAKFKANFDNGTINQSFSVDLKINKDKVIYLKGAKFMTIFKVKITPTSVAYYSPYAKNYFIDDFEMLQQILGVEINFTQLQNLFLGESILDLTKQKNDVIIEKNMYLLTPKIQQKLFDFLVYVNSKNFKLNQQSLVQTTHKRLDIIYKSYRFGANEYFPESFKIKVKREKKRTEMDFTLKSVIFNKTLAIPFLIPKNYKKLRF